MKKQQGFNHNIRHKGVLFHVQTEDYGQQLHKIVTQLFFSGQILDKRTYDYLDFLGQTDQGEKIVAKMKDQHKTVLKDLTEGRIDIPENIFSAEHVLESVDQKDD